MAEPAFPLSALAEPDLLSGAAARRLGRRALRAAFLGFFVDMFDVYLPVIALGPAMAYFQPASLSPAVQSTVFYVVFALSLVGRPIGATIFGHYSDTIGRRKVTMISMAGFAAVTLLIALLPGYATWGIGSLIVLISLRFVDGLFLGGQYTSANPLAMEYAPKNQRGAWAAFIHSGFPIAMIVMSLITGGLLRLVPAGSAHSPYAIWGWRIPFFAGALAATAVFLYYLRSVPESKVWAKSEKVKSPLQELFGRENLSILLQVFLLMSGAWFTLNTITSILPGVLLTLRHVDSITVTNAQLIENVVMALWFVPFGILGQKIGRRTVLWMLGLSGATIGTAAYYWLVRSAFRNPTELVVLFTLVNLCATPVWAIVTSYISERFTTRIRATGYGIGYSAAMIVPAFSSFYMLGLAKMGMPYEYTEVALAALGSLLLMIGALSGPETRHVDIA